MEDEVFGMECPNIKPDKLQIKHSCDVVIPTIKRIEMRITPDGKYEVRIDQNEKWIPAEYDKFNNTLKFSY